MTGRPATNKMLKSTASLAALPVMRPGRDVGPDEEPEEEVAHERGNKPDDDEATEVVRLGGCHLRLGGPLGHQATTFRKPSM